MSKRIEIEGVLPNELAELICEKLKAYIDCKFDEMLTEFENKEVESEYLKLARAEKLFDISRATLEELQKKQILTTFWVGNRRAVKVSEVRRFLQTRKTIWDKPNGQELSKKEKPRSRG